MGWDNETRGLQIKFEFVRKELAGCNMIVHFTLIHQAAFDRFTGLYQGFEYNVTQSDQLQQDFEQDNVKQDKTAM